MLCIWYSEFETELLLLYCKRSTGLKNINAIDIIAANKLYCTDIQRIFNDNKSNTIWLKKLDDHQHY